MKEFLSIFNGVIAGVWAVVAVGHGVDGDMWWEGLAYSVLAAFNGAAAISCWKSRATK